MAFAYVLINCELGYENQIISKLLEIHEIDEVRGIFGEFDIFVKLVSDSEENVGKIIQQIRKIPHIISTNTLSSIPSQDGN